MLALFHPYQAAWPINAGMPLGWIALVAAVVAGGYRRVQMGVRPSVDAVSLLGMATIGLAACVVRGLEWPVGSPIDPNWAYRTLMLGWATYALLITLATWWLARRESPLGLDHWRHGAEPCGPDVGARGRSGCRPAGTEGRVPSRRRGVGHGRIALGGGHHCRGQHGRGRHGGLAAPEGWAFAAALGVNLASSLVVWYFDETRHLTFAQCWLELLQANVIASSAVALVWLAGRRWLYEAREWTLGGSPLLRCKSPCRWPPTPFSC